MRMVTKISQLSAAAAIATALAACGSSSSSGGSPSGGSSGAGGATASSGGNSPSGSGSGGSSNSMASQSGSSSAAGGNAPDAKTLVHQSRTAYATAKSALLSTRTTQAGAVQTVRIAGTIDGTNQDATVAKAGEGRATIRTIGSTNYIKGDRTFWTKSSKAPAATAMKLADKWVHAPSTITSSSKDLNIKGFLDQSFGPSAIPDAKLATATTRKTTYHGKPAYVVTSSTSKNSITIDAATKLPLQFDSTKSASGSPSTVTLTGWNKQPMLHKPAGAISFPAPKA